MEPYATDRFEAAKAAFFAVHDEDPARPRAAIYHETLAAWVERLPRPGMAATEALRLAALCQHIRRWAIPRADYPLGKPGYKQWRARLIVLHCDEATRILTEVGYPEATIERVCELVGKKRFRSDPEAAWLEDAVCLTFLELEFAAFAEGHPPEKIEQIVVKTWDKMTPIGHAAALSLLRTWPETPELVALLARLSAPAPA